MKMKLKHHEQVLHATAAAFIRGEQPLGWLRTMNEWGIPPQLLKCFVLPEKNNPLLPAGLFVIFPKAHTAEVNDLSQCYGVIGNRLYIPSDAAPEPDISEAECQSLLIWDVQVFHPTLGFFGFNNSDQTDLAALLHFRTAQQADWSYARMGNLPETPLMYIRLNPVTTENLFNEIKDEVGSKPIEDLMDQDKRSDLKKITDAISASALKAALKLLISGGSRNNHSYRPGGGGGSQNNLLAKIVEWIGRKIEGPVQWMERKLEDIEKRRACEVDRLMEMLDKDPDEGLKYAIPLDNPYTGRGDDQADTLSRRNTSFSTNGIGGGRGGTWMLEHETYYQLRTKYQNAARQAKEQGDINKAAYIYAHLLHDFQQAAITLREGKYYREAAVIYKEHVKNLHEAADCYRKGGATMEALALYEELHDYETAGDIYQEMGREDAAMEHYKTCVTKALNKGDYIEAARVTQQKKKDIPAAKELLLKGWNGKREAVKCLGQYFDIAASENTDGLPEEVKHVYTAHTSEENRVLLMTSMLALLKTQNSQPLQETCTNIAYEIASKEAARGNLETLRLLGGFMPEDLRVNTDSQLYMSNRKPILMAPASDTRSFQLDEHATWKQVYSFRNKWLAVGYAANLVFVAHGDWEGHIACNVWPAPPNARLKLHVPENTTEDVVYYEAGFVLADKPVSSKGGFPPNLLKPLPGNITSLVSGAQLAVMDLQGGTYRIHGTVDLFELQHYNFTGNEVNRMTCRKDTLPGLQGISYSHNMVWHNNALYFGMGNSIVKIDTAHQYQVSHFNTGDFVNTITALNYKTSRFAIGTPGGIYIYYPAEERGNLGVEGVETNVSLYRGGMSMITVQGKEVSLCDMANGGKEAFRTKELVTGLIDGPGRTEIAMLYGNGQMEIRKV